jgi:hypothetical protein
LMNGGGPQASARARTHEIANLLRGTTMRLAPRDVSNAAKERSIMGVVGPMSKILLPKNTDPSVA